MQYPLRCNLSIIYAAAGAHGTIGPVYLRELVQPGLPIKMDTLIYNYLTPQQLAGFDRYKVRMVFALFQDSVNLSARLSSCSNK